MEASVLPPPRAPPKKTSKMGHWTRAVWGPGWGDQRTWVEVIKAYIAVATRRTQVVLIVFPATPVKVTPKHPFVVSAATASAQVPAPAEAATNTGVQAAIIVVEAALAPRLICAVKVHEAVSGVVESKETTRPLTRKVELFGRVSWFVVLAVELLVVSTVGVAPVTCLMRVSSSSSL
jgi:hypothetical protein